MRFEDRVDAANRLANALHAYQGKRPLILAIPRGAVPMGRVVARALEGDLDVVLVRKLGAPGNSEFAVGSVAEDGWTYVSPEAAGLGISPAYIEGERAAQLELMRRRRALYSPGREAADPRGRTCIVVDDGLATGATMIAALQATRGRGPAKLVCAAPVASPEALARIRPLADEVVCLSCPADFHAVGQFYRDFGAVDDGEVVRILSASASARA